MAIYRKKYILYIALILFVLTTIVAELLFFERSASANIHLRCVPEPCTIRLSCGRGGFQNVDGFITGSHHPLCYCDAQCPPSSTRPEEYAGGCTAGSPSGLGNHSCGGDGEYQCGTYPYCECCSGRGSTPRCSGNKPYGTHPNCRACSNASHTKCSDNVCRSACIGNVSNLTATAREGVVGVIDLSWGAVSGATSYEIQYATSYQPIEHLKLQNGQERGSASLRTTTTSTTNSKAIQITITDRSRYYFIVRAIKSAEKSLQWSNIAWAYQNKTCPTQPQQCGVGNITQRPDNAVVARTTTCQYTNAQTCPTIPTAQTPTYSVNPTTCDVNATFAYSGGNVFDADIKEGATTIHNFPVSTYEGITSGTEVYTLKQNDYNKTYTFNVRARNTTHPNDVWSEKTTKQFTTPTHIHPKSNFTIKHKDNRIYLTYIPENRGLGTGLQFNWSFSEPPTFHRGNQNSISPIVSFSTQGQKTITLQVVDTNISQTKGGCSTSQIIQAEATPELLGQMKPPTIDEVQWLLTPVSCRPTGRLLYTSKEPLRKDILNLSIGDTQVYTNFLNNAVPSTRYFTFPINPNTEYTADITTYDFKRTPTKSPSTPATFVFVSPPTSTFPTANFTHTISKDRTLSLTYTGTDSVQWNFTEPVSYIEGTSTSPSIRVQFPTYGNKTIHLTATTTATELNACVNSKVVNIQPDPQQYIIPKVREVPPTPLR